MDANIQEVNPEQERRGFLATFTMAVGLFSGYGVFAWNALRFLYPWRANETKLQFVCTLDQLQIGNAIDFTTPDGAKVVVARQDEGAEASSFIALSSVCPHLGCKVHWESNNDRFFCPCHNGAFNSKGEPTEGPVAQANQHLTRFPLAVEGNLLMIEIPKESVQVSDEAAG